MTMSAFDSKVICVTNRKLCPDDFLERIRRIARCHPHAILLREKDLAPREYEQLARAVMEICDMEHTPCILHSFIDVARELQSRALHLPLPLLRVTGKSLLEEFEVLGTSCHSMEEAQEAEAMGCSYITLGHIFATDCKKGLSPRGIPFLKEVCGRVRIPVYAIGGISPQNIAGTVAARASGACIMSGLMQCADIEACMYDLKRLAAAEESF